MAEYIDREGLRSKAIYLYGFGKIKYVPLKVIEEAPAVDVVPVRHGRWLDNEDYMFCSCCGASWNYCDNDTQDFKFCPHCGAKMDGEER